MNKVGNLLKETRESRGLSIDDVVEATKIQRVYIDAIEKGNFSFFKNQDFYQQVFVGSYADFLSLDKNETLVALQADAKVYDYSSPNADKKTEAVQPQAVQSEPAKPVQPEIKKPAPVRAEFLTDYEVKSQPEDPAVTNANLKNEIINDARQEEQATDEINQLIDEINQNVEVDLNEYFEDAPVAQEKEELIHSSILDDIQKINEDVDQNKPEVPTIQAAPEQFNLKADEFEQTDVIDLTSGIEIETVAKEQMAQPLAQESVDIVATPDNNSTEQMRAIFDVPKASSDDEVIAALENTLKTQLDLNIIEEDPDRTSMDLKVAKALGDSKIVIDKKDEKKIKRDKMIDRLLFLVIIVLVGVLAFYLFKLGIFNF